MFLILKSNPRVNGVISVNVESINLYIRLDFPTEKFPVRNILKAKW
jgi:hypothetical protein